MNWRCPYCNTYSAIKEDVDSGGFRYVFTPNKSVGRQLIEGELIFCRNGDCNKYSLALVLSKGRPVAGGGTIAGDELHSWQLLPESSARPFPEYIPSQLLADYREACLIRNKSAKASATLARRCLQGMIRDFWNIRKARLKDEVDALEDKVEPDVWQAIDAVRKIGNIGAHMEKDIDLIIDVEPEEAGLLIELLETLFEEWYVAKHQREEKMAKIRELAAQKDLERKSGKAPETPIGGPGDAA